MRKVLVLLAAGVACAGCMSVTWKPPPRPIGTAPDSLTALCGFEEMRPRRLQMTCTVAIQQGRRRFTGPGFLDVNRELSKCDLLAMTPSGAMRFEVNCANGESRCRFTDEPFSANPAVAEAIARDVQRMCFDLVPPGSASSRGEANTLIARSEANAAATEWVFGSGSLLLEKRFFEGGALAAQVGYYDYSLERGRRLAHRVVLQNVRHDYWLTVDMKELRVCE